jgi:hypothetical protein
VHCNNFTAAHAYIIGVIQRFQRIWILSKLVLPSPSDVLIRYIITTCYPKMVRRLRNEKLSRPYITSLRQVTTFLYVEPKKQREQLLDEIENDRLLFCKFLPVTASKLRTKLPKIEEQVAS